MPPGTGDVQMGLARMLPSTDLIVVTTPALAAQKVAQRAADMARRSFLKVVGVIENMSAFTCDHGATYALFGSGGGEALAAAINAPLLGQIPLEPLVAAGNDAGAPVAIDGTGAAAELFRSIAAHIIDEIAPPSKHEDVDMTGCSARLFDSDDPTFTKLETAVTVGPRSL
jgi:ATP-binding protein involved in chromosome partitioning